MEKPGSEEVILDDFLYSLEKDPTKKFSRLLAGTPDFDDRGVAVVFGALLESALETAISTHFSIDEAEARRLFSYTDDGPLSNFSAKIEMGYALGVYDDQMRSDLKWISRIRNAFAHARIQVNFDNNAIALACDQMKFPRKEAPIIKTARQRFTMCVAFLVTYLRGEQGWPSPRKWHDNAVYRVMYKTLPSSEK